MTWTILTADVLAGLATLPDASVQTVITSPPYWGLRDYGTAAWEGDDAACDHLRPVKQHKDGCLGCGCPMQDVTPGCRWCADRHEKRRIHGTPEGRSYEEPSEKHWEKPRSRDQVTEAGVPYIDRCGKCNAVRIDSQLGLEPTPEAYVERLVGVFREIRRVLRPDGTAWLNLGDSYAHSMRQSGADHAGEKQNTNDGSIRQGFKQLPAGMKEKDLVGIPWRVAFALQADGWYLRSDVIWAKPNPMPESVTDRPTKAHEYMFLLTRSARYFYDADAVRESAITPWHGIGGYRNGNIDNGYKPDEYRNDEREAAGRNLRSVWNIATEPFPEAHFATFPKALVVPCVKAGTSEKGCCAECGAAFVRVREATANGRTVTVEGGARKTGLTQDNGLGDGRGSFTMKGDLIDYRTVGWAPSCTHHEADVVPCTVLDPFAGSGTVGVVALRYGRSFVGIELSPTYAEMARERIRNDAPLWNHAAELV